MSNFNSFQMKKIYSIIAALAITAGASAQYNLQISYDATTSGNGAPLVGAAKVYMHSGGNDTPGPLDGSTWNYVVGNWGNDDGIGEMQPTGTADEWTITIDPVSYYSQASNGPVVGSTVERIGMVFRNADGTLGGKDANDQDIFVDLSNPAAAAVFNTDGTPFSGVTATLLSSVNNISKNKLGVTNAPNPLAKNTVFTYSVPATANVSLNIFDATGRVVKNLFNELQAAGIHQYNYIGDDNNGNALANGVYYYTVSVGAQQASGKLIISRN